MRAAICNETSVLNVIEYDVDSSYEPPDGLTLIQLDSESRVSPGWRLQDDQFVQPSVKSLLSEPLKVPADSSTPALVIYTNTYDESPSEVVFDVNGATITVPLIDDVAELEVTAEQPGEILVTCDGLSVTILATEV